MDAKRGARIAIVATSCALADKGLEYSEVMRQVCRSLPRIAAPAALPSHLPHTHSDPYEFPLQTVSQVAGISTASAMSTEGPASYVIMKAWPYGRA